MARAATALPLLQLVAQLYFTNMRQAVWRHRIPLHTVSELPLLERGSEPLVLIGT